MCSYPRQPGSSPSIGRLWLIPLTNGSNLGRYEILDRLGAGGMGEVYRARDPRLGRDVAIKILPAAISTDPERLRRFEQEARATAALNHPNILAVYDIGSESSAAYVVSELLDGQTLRAAFEGSAGLPLRKASITAFKSPRVLRPLTRKASSIAI